MASTFHHLETVHAHLEELFARHQDALVERDLAQARAHLARYREHLAVHMADEEDRLMPLYADRVGDIPGASPQMILDEHRKLRELLEEIEARAEALDDTPAARDVVGLIDLEHRFKGLVEHHHLREHNLFYPKLDAATSPEERATALAGCTLSFEP